MAMTLFSTVTVGAGGAASVEFTSIPQTGIDILVLVSARGDNVNGKVTVNGITSTYFWRNLFGTGSSTASTSQDFVNYITVLGLLEPKNFNGVDNTTGIVSNGFLYIPNYAGSNEKRLFAETVNEMNATEAYQTILVGRIPTSDAITSVKIESESGNLLQYSTISLYIIS